MFRLIRSGDFNPDLSALERVVLLSDSVGETNMGDTMQPQVEQVDNSDSESSVASETGGLERNALSREQLQARSSLPCSLIFQGCQSHR